MNCPICNEKISRFYIFHPTGHFLHQDCGKNIRFVRNWFAEYAVLAISAIIFSQITITFKSATLFFGLIFLIFAIPLFLVRFLERLEFDQSKNWVVRLKTQFFYLTITAFIASVIRDVVYLQWG